MPQERQPTFGELDAVCSLADADKERAVLAERERIASALMSEAESCPCGEDASVYRSAAWLVRADFSYEEAERLEAAAEQQVNASY